MQNLNNNDLWPRLRHVNHISDFLTEFLDRKWQAHKKMSLILRDMASSAKQAIVASLADLSLINKVQ